MSSIQPSPRLARMFGKDQRTVVGYKLILGKEVLACCLETDVVKARQELARLITGDTEGLFHSCEQAGIVSATASLTSASVANAAALSMSPDGPGPLSSPIGSITSTGDKTSPETGGSGSAAVAAAGASISTPLSAGRWMGTAHLRETAGGGIEDPPCGSAEREAVSAALFRTPLTNVGNVNVQGLGPSTKKARLCIPIISSGPSHGGAENESKAFCRQQEREARASRGLQDLRNKAAHSLKERADHMPANDPAAVHLYRRVLEIKALGRASHEENTREAEEISARMSQALAACAAEKAVAVKAAKRAAGMAQAAADWANNLASVAAATAAEAAAAQASEEAAAAAASTALRAVLAARRN